MVHAGAAATLKALRSMCVSCILLTQTHLLCRAAGGAGCTLAGVGVRGPVQEGRLDCGPAATVKILCTVLTARCSAYLPVVQSSR